MILLRYLGKKAGFTLHLPYLSKDYTVEGPGAEIPFENADATNIMATSPKMFKVIGISRDEPKAGDPGQTIPVHATGLPAQTMMEAVQELADQKASVATATDMLKDDPPNESLGEPKVPLTGDGIEGEDDPPDGKTPPAPSPPSGPVPIATLMTYKVAELRAYAKEVLGHEFASDEKRNEMIKKIKQLEQTKAQAAS